MGPLQLPQASKTLFSIDRHIEAGFKNLCCKIADTQSDYEFVPVYEYMTLYTNIISDIVDAGEDYYPYTFDKNVSDITFSFGTNVFNTCLLYTEQSDPIQSEITYRDSLGRTIYSTGRTTLVIPTDVYPNYTVQFQLEILRSSGFMQVFEGTYELDNSGTVIDDSLTIIKTYSNSNVCNSSFNAVNGLIPLSYELMVADIYAVFTNGVFVKYIDIDGNDYVPTGCLSLNPVMPFTPLTYPQITPIYNTTLVNLVSNSTFTINANTAHSVSYVVTTNTLDLTIGVNTVTGLPKDTQQSINSTVLIDEDITFDTTGAAGVVVVTYTIPTSL